MSGFMVEEFDDFMEADAGEEYNKAYASKARAFPYLKMSQLPEGMTKTRLLPAVPGPDACPDGAVFVATHEVSLELGAAKHPRVKCIFRKSTPCFIHDVMKMMAPEKSTLAPSIQEALTDMSSDRFKCIAFPVLVMAKPSSDTDNKAPWVASKEEHGGLLQVYSENLQLDLRNLMKSNPRITSETKGFWFKLGKKGNKYTVEIDKIDPDPLLNAVILEKWRNTKMTNAFYKGVHDFTYDQQKDFLSKAWWMKDEKVRAVLSAYDEAPPFEPDFE